MPVRRTGETIRSSLLTRRAHRAIVPLSVHARLVEPATCRSRVTEGNWRRRAGSRLPGLHHRTADPHLRQPGCAESVVRSLADDQRVIGKAVDIAVEPVEGQMLDLHFIRPPALCSDSCSHAVKLL